MEEMLLHCSSKPITTVFSVKQTPPETDHFWCKPKGLWVSPKGEDDWASWCAAERFNTGHLVYQVHLATPNNILWVASLEALQAFENRYRIPGPGFYSHATIDWCKVAEDYQGIIIAPYQWKARYDLFWYYGWDCASGCIWDANAVESIQVMEPADLTNATDVV